MSAPVGSINSAAVGQRVEIVDGIENRDAFSQTTTRNRKKSRSIVCPECGTTVYHNGFPVDCPNCETTIE